MNSMNNSRYEHHSLMALSRKSAHLRPQDGTVNYALLSAVTDGLRLLSAYMPFLPLRLSCLTTYLVSSLLKIRHDSTGRPVVCILSRRPGARLKAIGEQAETASTVSLIFLSVCQLPRVLVLQRFLTSHTAVRRDDPQLFHRVRRNGLEDFPPYWLHVQPRGRSGYSRNFERHEETIRRGYPQRLRKACGKGTRRRQDQLGVSQQLLGRMAGVEVCGGYHRLPSKER